MTDTVSKTTMQFNCGCGFTTQKLEEAEKHSLGKRHTVAILGEVRAEREKPVAKTIIKEDK